MSSTFYVEIIGLFKLFTLFKMYTRKINKDKRHLFIKHILIMCGFFLVKIVEILIIFDIWNLLFKEHVLCSYTLKIDSFYSFAWFFICLNTNILFEIKKIEPKFAIKFLKERKTFIRSYTYIHTYIVHKICCFIQIICKNLY